MRALIVNADDLGQGAAVNAGIAEAHEHGIVTSASLMVRRSAAGEAAAYARAHPELGVGLHLELDDVPDGAVAGEVAAQLDAFCDLVGAMPTHIDSHHHVHSHGTACVAAVELGRATGLPVRHFSHARYCGDFYGLADDGTPRHDAITAGALRVLVEALPQGVTELCCHPARGPVPGTSYGPERALELAALCDPSVRETVEGAGVRLLTFRELG